MIGPLGVERVLEIEDGLDDPRVFVALGRLFKKAGNKVKSKLYAKKAADAFDEMLKDYPRLWAAPGAEFYLG